MSFKTVEIMRKEVSTAAVELKKKYHHVEEFLVRDYECDLQGIVNNAVYQNYLEHARHQFLLDRGINFVALSEQGVNLVVIRAEIDYKSPLRAGNEFWVGTRLKKISKLKFAFEQDIFIVGSDSIAINALVIGTAMNDRGKPIRFAELDFSGESR